jgi:hypothetical protein
MLVRPPSWDQVTSVLLTPSAGPRPPVGQQSSCGGGEWSENLFHGHWMFRGARGLAAGAAVKFVGSHAKQKHKCLQPPEGTESKHRTRTSRRAAASGPADHSSDSTWKEPPGWCPLGQATCTLNSPDLIADHGGKAPGHPGRGSSEILRNSINHSGFTVTLPSAFMGHLLCTFLPGSESGALGLWLNFLPSGASA